MKPVAPIIPITDEPQCEGCAAIATTFDPEGVPLCEKCAESYVMLLQPETANPTP